MGAAAASGRKASGRPPLHSGPFGPVAPVRSGTVISHLSLGVRDLDRAGSFYDAVLAPLGYVRVWTADSAIGYGPPDGNDKLALKAHGEDKHLGPAPGFHLAFAAPDHAAVDAFHAEALRVGAESAGDPGLRVQYSPTYYAAFVLDLDGHKLEAVHQ